jgi:hypothetical protein
VTSGDERVAGPPGWPDPADDSVTGTPPLRRAAGTGARIVSFPDNPSPLGLPSFYSDHWGPLWDAFEETGVVVSLHFGSGSFVPASPRQRSNCGLTTRAASSSPCRRGSTMTR